MLVSIHRSATQNVGDLLSSPVHHFQEFANVPILDLMGWQSEDEQQRAAWQAVYDKATVLMIGGGGLLNMPKFEPSLKKFMEEKQTLILWGCGHNEVRMESWAGLRRAYTLRLASFALAGTRDAEVSSRWVPCVTCMSPLLDRSYEIKHDFVFYANRGISNNSQYTPGEFTGDRFMGNLRHSFEDIIAFLGSAETVVTSSFHGAYWATLLGRKVVAIPTSSKFYALKHPVPLCHARDWRRYALLARTYPDALAECREATLRFKDDVMALLDRVGVRLVGATAAPPTSVAEPQPRA